MNKFISSAAVVVLFLTSLCPARLAEWSWAFALAFRILLALPSAIYVCLKIYREMKKK